VRHEVLHDDQPLDPRLSFIGVGNQQRGFLHCTLEHADYSIENAFAADFFEALGLSAEATGGASGQDGASH
jgi:hypothetical protein